MKQDRDWLNTVGERLRDAETPLPKGGWERLAGELPVAAPGKTLWVRRWPQYAAAAAVVLICLAAGDAYWRASRQAGTDIPAIAAVFPDVEPEVPKQPEMPAVAETVSVVAQTKPGKGVSQVGVLHINTEIHEFDYQVNGMDGADVPEPESPAEAPADRNEVAADQSEVTATRAVAENPEQQSVKPQSVRQRSFAAAADPFAEPMSKQRSGDVLFGAKAGGTLTSGGKQNGVLPRALISAMAGGNMMDKIAGNAVGVPMQMNFAECSYAHKQPLSFAFTAGKEFPYGLSLESGISYTLLRSQVTLPYASSDVTQSLHMLGIPVRLNWSWLNRGGFSLYLSGGGLAEKCISARFGEEKIQEKAVQFSVFGALGAQYKLGKHVGLYFEPEVSYYFTETMLRTSRTDSPVSFTLQLGVRLSY